MASPAERLIDEAVKHRIALSRYSTATVRKVLALLNRTDARLVERILRADNEGRDPVQLERLLEEVRALQSDGWTVLRGRLNEDVAALADAERLFTERMVHFGQRSVGLATVTNAPTTAQVVAAVNARPFQGRYLRGWLDEAEAGAAKRVRETLRQGFVEGRSVTALVREIRGTRALQYKDGVLEISRRGAEAMVRTALTHTASVASKETYQALAVEEARFIATLETRTCLVCATLHNTVHPLATFPWSPRHIACRCTSIPVIKGLPPIEAPSYSDWLMRQPVEVQNDVLGVRKAQLFRSGKLTLDRFVDSKGRVLTLEELKKRDAAAFEGL
nr:phage minor head protein [Brevundimonas naejangsanensis]